VEVEAKTKMLKSGTMKSEFLLPSSEVAVVEEYLSSVALAAVLKAHF
jgi:hypothetical protein